MKYPLVSIMMNCFNGERYLHESLKSVLSQNYKNWELIFWDNQSTDNSKKIIKSFKDKRIKYFYAKQHTNLHKARNQALKKCKGIYIAFLDTDDIWHPRKLSKQISELKKSKKKIIYSNCLILNKQTFIKKKKLSNKKLPSGFIFLNLIDNYLIFLCTLVFEKKILIENNLRFDETFKIIGDFDLVMKLALKYEIRCVQENLATYRIHKKSFSINNKLLEVYEQIKWYKHFIKVNKINKIQKKKFSRFKRKIYLKKKVLLAKNLKEKILLVLEILINFDIYNLKILFKSFFSQKLKNKLFFYE